MKDIGLGILDRYTVVIVIIVLALSNLVFGLTVPFDTSNATQLIFSLVIFTGYFYLARSIVRLPVAIVTAILVFDELMGNVGPSYRGFSGLWNRIVGFFASIWSTPVWIFLTALLTLDFSNPQFDLNYPSKRIAKIKKSWFAEFLLIIDRLSVVLIAFIVMLKDAQPFVQILGIIGASVLLVFFLFRGHFSALLPDQLLQEIKKEKQPQITVNTPKPKKPADKNWYGYEVPSEEVARLDAVKIIISHCKNCGKVCAESHTGDLPQFCSLKCQQEWYPTWEHDWCIGQGKEWKIIETQRLTGYADLEKMDAAVGKLKAIVLSQVDQMEALWALFGMVRDVSAGSSYYWRYERISAVETAFWLILKKKRVFVDNLLLLLLDENESLVLFALKFLEKYPPNPDEVNDINLRALLNHSSWRVRSVVIPILARMGRYDDLFARLGQNEILENSLVLQMFKDGGKSTIKYLEKAQKHPVRSVQHDATEALFVMGIEAKKPTIVERRVECPYEDCHAPVTITYSADYIEFDFKGVEELGFWQFRKFKTKCPSCHARIGVKLNRSFVHIIKKQNEEWYAKLLADHVAQKNNTSAKKISQ